MATNDVVWDVYDNYRTARLNVKYYSARLAKLERINTSLDVIVAIAAPSSALSGLFFLKTTEGAFVWQCIAAISAIVALVKPFLKLGQKIKFYDQTLSGYRALDYDLNEIVMKIRSDDSYSSTSKRMFESAIKKMRVLATNPPENTQDKKLIEKLVVEVNKEIPTSSLYIPQENQL